MSRSVPYNLQFELAMLWRTLSILQSIDESSVISFYEKLIPNLKVMPKLSLSNYWHEIDKNKDNQSLVGLSIVSSSDEYVDSNNADLETKQRDNIPLMNINELNYLKHDEAIDEKHDPLQVIQKLYGTAVTCIEKSSCIDDRNILLSACLAMAIKSGRISLLLHVMMMIYSLDDIGIQIDTNSIKDICEYYSTIKVTNISTDKQAIISNLINITNDDPLLNQKNQKENLGEKYIVNHISNKSYFMSEYVSYHHHPSVRKEDKSNGILLSFGKADHGIYTHIDR